MKNTSQIMQALWYPSSSERGQFTVLQWPYGLIDRMLPVSSLALCLLKLLPVQFIKGIKQTLLSPWLPLLLLPGYPIAVTRSLTLLLQPRSKIDLVNKAQPDLVGFPAAVMKHSHQKQIDSQVPIRH